MRPVPVYGVTCFFFGNAYILFVGGTVTRGSRVDRPFTLPCRAGVHARRTDQFFKFFQCAAGPRPRPTLQGKHHAVPATVNVRTVSRAACMPPLRIDRTPSRPKNGIVRQTWRAACMRPLQGEGIRHTTHIRAAARFAPVFQIPSRAARHHHF